MPTTEVMLSPNLTDVQLAQLWHRFPNLSFRQNPRGASAGAEILLLGAQPPNPRPVGSYRWIHLLNPAAEKYLTDLPRSATLTITRGLKTQIAAEHAFALLLALTNRLPAFPAQPPAKRLPPLTDLKRLTIGVAGLGQVGRAVIRLARRNGLRTVGLSRRAGACPGVGKIFGPAEKLRFLSLADFYVVALPPTPSTRGFFDQEAISAMRDGSYLVSLAHRPIIDEAALAEALRVGKLGGVGLDVFENDPLPEDSPLRGLSAVIIAPHPTGGTAYRELAFRLFVRNLERYLAQRPLLHQIRPEDL